MPLYFFIFFLVLNFHLPIPQAKGDEMNKMSQPNFLWNMLFCKDQVRYIGEDKQGNSSLRIFSSVNPSQKLANTGSLIKEVSENEEDPEDDDEDDKVSESEVEESTIQNIADYNICIKPGKIHECLEYKDEAELFIQERFAAYKKIAWKEEKEKSLGVCKELASTPGLCSQYTNETPLEARIRWKSYNSSLLKQPIEDSNVFSIDHTFQYFPKKKLFEIFRDNSGKIQRVEKISIANLPSFKSQLSGLISLLPKGGESNSPKETMEFSGTQILDISGIDYSGPFISDEAVLSSEPINIELSPTTKSLASDFLEQIPPKEKEEVLRLMKIFSVIRNLDLPEDLWINKREDQGNPLKDEELRQLAKNKKITPKTIVDVKIFCWQGDPNSAQHSANPEDLPDILSRYSKEKTQVPRQTDRTPKDLAVKKAD